MKPPKRSFHFPSATLYRQAGRLKDALNDGAVGPPVLARLPANFLPDFAALSTQVGNTPALRASQKGNTGTMTIEQDAAYLEMQRLMSAARRSASLAFPGNDVVLHEEFKVGEHTPQTLAAEVIRATVIAASADKYSTQLGEHGWIKQDQLDLVAASTALGTDDSQQETSADESEGLTADAIRDLNKLYKNCLSIQNAARFQFLSTGTGNEMALARYLLGEFPPHAPAPPPPPAAAAPQEAAPRRERRQRRTASPSFPVRAAGTFRNRLHFAAESSFSGLLIPIIAFVKLVARIVLDKFVTWRSGQDRIAD
ncbi:MAG: hypothetical protein ACR2NX_08210 [Chthoniobacterales bacterium]